MSKIIPIILIILLVSTIKTSNGFMENYDKIIIPSEIKQTTELAQIPKEITQNYKVSRYLVFGHGNVNDLKSYLPNMSGISSDYGFFSIVTIPEQTALMLDAKGYYVIKDFPLEYHGSEKTGYGELNQIRKAAGSELAYIKYNYTGAGIKIAIVDTGVDFSNPDIKDSLARNKNNEPIMLDSDGQGIIITNATFLAKINEYGTLDNATKYFTAKKSRELNQNATSSVYVTDKGVFLNLKQNGKGTPILMYNSFFPTNGLSPVFNGTILDDYKIGRNSHDYIKSASGLYHFGIIYQGTTQGPFSSVQAVPALVVDSTASGIYDTIIPDMSTSWKDYTRFELKGQKPDYDFDFTDESPIKIGGGNEFLVYDFDKDGKLDYSAGTVGAQVVDVYGVISHSKSSIDKILKATNGTLLPALDSHGNFFGVMNDFVGHGTSSAASIASKGIQQYDIYNNTKKYTLPGIAPGAKIIPVKALWFGDTVYGWLWAAGFDNKNSTWQFSGKPRADIISNSWGVSNFPSLKASPGVDMLSLIVSVLSVPGSIDERYPGITIVSSAGNAGHGYGTIGLPNAAPFGITVGATTNNVFVGYGAFKGQPRFGNTTTYANDVVDFSSRGPSIIGDPKPDLMNTGAYGFTPSNVLKKTKTSKQEPFSLFGGTSMAAPLVSGTAAILMESLHKKLEDYDSFKIKNILMSTATDLQNDPFTQGSGLVNAYKAVSFVNGKDGVFIVHNNSTYQNIKKVLDIPIAELNSTSLGISQFKIPEKTYEQASWFAGRLDRGDKSSTAFTVENPNNHTISVKIIPQQIKLIETSEINSTTKVRLSDSMINKSGTYRPDYVRLADVKKHDTLSSYYDNSTIPKDASLLILNLNFPFGDFMNKTEKMYAGDIKIASLYLYDWSDKDKDKKIESDELSMVNRAGSWGTVEEMRVSDPQSKLQNTPLIGVYPVPTRYSYWLGETKKNSTSMDYTLSASYYKKADWSDVWLDSSVIFIPPKSTSKVTATINVPNDKKPGLYQGFISFVGNNHTANIPVSYGVVSQIKHEQLAVISGTSNNDVMYGNGYVKGAFDMINRYNAGDWRQYYFDVKNPKITSAFMEMSWKDPDTNFSVFVVDPKGRIIQSNVPPGVFGQLMDWPTSDWLGTSIFSEGGGFYPVKNKDNTSTVLYAPINQTGIYTMMVHSTLFGGQSTTEPVKVIAKFSSLFADDTSPQIVFPIAKFVNSLSSPIITDENAYSAKYTLDGNEIIFDNATIHSISEGLHQLQIVATDETENTSAGLFEFTIDRTAPQITIKSPINNTKISDGLVIDYTIQDANIGETSVILPNGTTLQNKTFVQIPADDLSLGLHQITISAKDLADNKIQQTIFFDIEPHNAPTKTSDNNTLTGTSDNNMLLWISFGIAIVITGFIIFSEKSRKSSK
jgi:subtilisin family serine protease